MCKRIEYKAGQYGCISIGIEEDVSQRVTEVVIVNTKPFQGINAEEGQGIRVICRADGTIVGGVDLIEGVDILGHAEMKG